MLTTKRYEYLAIEKIGTHPSLVNHRPMDMRKVKHYEKDILSNGLLEPLVVWEKNHGEYYLIGGFHRLSAIHGIRTANPGFFDHVDVRVVAGDLDEMRALNLKLNADRVDTKITDYFDTVIYLNNVNWSKERIADFLDKSVSWIDELIRYVPSMDPAIRKLLEDGTISWKKARDLIRTVREAPPGQEKQVLQKELTALPKPGEKQATPKKPLTLRVATKRLTDRLQQQPDTTYTVGGEDLMSLFLVLEGRRYNGEHMERVKNSFPGLLD